MPQLLQFAGWHEQMGTLSWRHLVLIERLQSPIDIHLSLDGPQENNAATQKFEAVPCWPAAVSCSACNSRFALFLYSRFLPICRHDWAAFEARFLSA